MVKVKAKVNDKSQKVQCERKKVTGKVKVNGKGKDEGNRLR